MIQLKSKVLSQEQIEFVKKWYPIFGYSFCREKVGITSNHIEIVTRKFNLKVNKTYDCNIRDYLDIDDPIIVYSLGFIWADGHLQKKGGTHALSVKVVETDGCYFQRITDRWAELGFKWGVYSEKGSTRIHKGVKIVSKPAVKFSLCDRFIGRFLSNHDYGIKSGASADKILAVIKPELRYLFFRGYFDGDGSFYYQGVGKQQKVTFSSCVNQDWSFILSLCKQIDVSPCVYITKPNKLGKSSVVQIPGRNGCINFLNYIYQNRDIDKIGYDRKYENFLSARLQPINYTSNLDGVCFMKSGPKNRKWLCYHKRKNIGFFASEEEAFAQRNNYIKNLDLHKDDKIIIN